LVWNTQPTPAPVAPAAVAAPPRIAIGIPYTSGFTALFALKTFGPLIFQPVSFAEKIHQMCRGIPLHIARDQIVQASLADKAVTHILWVDTDMVCEQPNNPNQALEILLNTNAPIAAGLYRAKQEIGFNYAAWKMAADPTGKLGFLPIQSWDGNWIEVDVTGLGFCLIKREVYEKTPPPWHPWTLGGTSEDFSFFIKARSVGYKVMVMTDVKLSHIGDMQVHPDGKITVLEV
jgi:hypothetical protein